MAKSTEVAERPSSAVQRETQRGQEPGSGPQRATTLRPPVDIFEDAEGVTLLADLPGVSKERLNVRVERDALVIEGDVQIELPEGMEALYADVRATHYQRRFALSDELEAEKIDAILKDGVLTVHVPKRAETKPRRIEVRT
jgi:HSP20 family molecular chaperone IbpA